MLCSKSSDTYCLTICKFFVNAQTEMCDYIFKMSDDLHKIMRHLVWGSEITVCEHWSKLQKCVIQNSSLGIRCEITPRWMLQNLAIKRSTLFQTIASVSAKTLKAMPARGPAKSFKLQVLQVNWKVWTVQTNVILTNYCHSSRTCKCFSCQSTPSIASLGPRTCKLRRDCSLPWCLL